MALPDTTKSPVLCVDIGGTSTKAGVLSTSGDMQFLNSIPTKPDVKSYVQNLVSLIGQTIATAKAHGQDLHEMGVA
ncbi:MAG TPA: hypothetical protein VGE93_13480, partial [Bryobacteraceae bacterium]